MNGIWNSLRYADKDGSEERCKCHGYSSLQMGLVYVLGIVVGTGMGVLAHQIFGR